MNKTNGLLQKYEVKKLSNPTKEMDCIVLEFDDPIAQIGIRAWAEELHERGYTLLALDVISKLPAKHNPQGE